MKKNILIVAALMVAVTFTSCGNNQNSKKGTHTHDDGSVHEAHTEAPAPAKNSKQESFKVDGATQIQINTMDHGHDHEVDHTDSEHAHDHSKSSGDDHGHAHNSNSGDNH